MSMLRNVCCFTHRGLVYLLFGLVLGTCVSSRTLAINENCRDIQFRGESGPLSQDKVKFHVKDSAGTLLDESCEIQVKANEFGDDFAARIPGAWGTGGVGSESCGPLNFGLNLPTRLPNNTCGSVAVSPPYSCKHSLKTLPAKPRANPPIPKTKVLRICCFEGSTSCRGKAIGSKTGRPATFTCTAGNVGHACTVDAGCDTSPGNGRCGRRPITLQALNITTNDPPGFQPPDSDLPSVGGISPVVVDPIGMVQRAPKTLQSCRGALRTAMKSLAQTTVDTREKCYGQVMAGKLDPGTDCTSVDIRGKIAAAKDNLKGVATTNCLPQGSPLRQGFKTCPAASDSPCQGIPMNTCTAPSSNVGNACASPADCDSSPGYGDGRCGAPGDWASAADCLSCLGDYVTTTAVYDKYGDAPPIQQDPPDPGIAADINCQDAIGNALGDLISAQLGVTFTCQSGLDAGITPLPLYGMCTNGTVLACTVDSDCDSAPEAGDGRCGPDGVCIAGGASCTADEDCDSSPSAGDGRCGPDGGCFHCAVDQNCDTVRSSGDGVCTGGVCSRGMVGSCVSNRDCDTVKSSNDGRCGAGYCKDVDPTSGRAKAEGQAGAAMTKACVVDQGTTDLIPDLSSCGIDIDSETTCVIANGRSVGAALADAVIPEGIITPCFDTTGCWAGSYTGGSSGTWNSNLVPSGTTLSGSVTIHDNVNGTQSGSVSGTIMCNQITFGTVSGGITFAGTVTSSNTMSGTWSSSTFGSGTWAGSRCLP